jgi:hypothetical protein
MHAIVIPVRQATWMSLLRYENATQEEEENALRSLACSTLGDDSLSCLVGLGGNSLTRQAAWLSKCPDCESDIAP